MKHYLKILPQFYSAVEDGSKNFEVMVRVNNRAFQKGDLVVLKEWDHDEALNELGDSCPRGYTGRSLTFTIGYVFPIDAERVVLSLIKPETSE